MRFVNYVRSLPWLKIIPAQRDIATFYCNLSVHQQVIVAFDRAKHVCDDNAYEGSQTTIVSSSSLRSPGVTLGEQLSYNYWVLLIHSLFLMYSRRPKREWGKRAIQFINQATAGKEHEAKVSIPLKKQNAAVKLPQWLNSWRGSSPQSGTCLEEKDKLKTVQTILPEHIT